MKTPEQMGENLPAKREKIKYTRNDKHLEKILFDSEEKMLEEYKNNEKFKETINELENIVKNAGLEGLSMTMEENTIGVGGHIIYSLRSMFDEESAQKIGVYEKSGDIVWFSKNILENIRKLFIVDKKFAKEIITNIINHEKHHLLGPAGKLGERGNREIEEEITNTETNNIWLAKVKLDKINREYYPYEEKQADLQRINEYYKNLDDFIEAEAKHIIGVCVIFNGFDYLKKASFDPANIKLTNVFDLIDKKVYKEIDEKGTEAESNKNNEPVDKAHLSKVPYKYIHNNVHDPANKRVDKKYEEIELHKKIIERAEEMRKDLVKKYEEHKGEF